MFNTSIDWHWCDRGPRERSSNGKTILPVDVSDSCHGLNGILPSPSARPKAIE